MHWLCDKEILKQIRVYWDKGKNNYSDYFTNNFSPSVHRQQRPRYIQSAHLATTIQYRSQTEITRLCEGVFNRFLSPSVLDPKSQSMTHKSNRVPCTQSHIAQIRAKPQSMNQKCHTDRRLKCSRQLIMYLINNA